jgi:hypothetical protein
MFLTTLSCHCLHFSLTIYEYRVPLGFVCGYPVGIGGELYGGSMFHPSAATDTLQGRAIQKINELWGEEHRGWESYKNIGIPVCKKKYKPFDFTIQRRNEMTGEVEIRVVRMYGCHAHSNIRKAVIERHGERKGWEPFGQWSLTKAKLAARRESKRLNAQRNSSDSSASSSGYDSSVSTSSSEEETSSSSFCVIKEDFQGQQPWQTLCHNGACNWKLRGKYDDIREELSEELLCKPVGGR